MMTSSRGPPDERWMWLGLSEGMTMSELPDLADQQEMIERMAVDLIDQNALAEQLLEQAREQNIELVGPGGLLGQLTKGVLETALDAEMSEHLGYEKHDLAGRNSGNSHKGTRSETVLTEISPVEIEVPKDTESSFEPQIVRKRRRWLDHSVRRTGSAPVRGVGGLLVVFMSSGFWLGCSLR